MINLGVIGSSEGNGHPYSWSAIINGYDAQAMQACPFPVIPDYLGRKKYPDDFIKNARVTHIWTQDHSISQHIAQASKIEQITDTPEDMIGHTDAILLARDDYQNHMRIAKPFLEAGLPIYIDKPLSNSVADAQALFDLQQYPQQIFTCSALRYLPEFESLRERSGDIKSIYAHTPKSWSLYGIHIVEPIVALLKLHDFNEIVLQKKDIVEEKIKINLTYKKVNITLESSGTPVGQIFYDIIFENGKSQRIVVHDVFIAFRSALETFLNQAQNNNLSISREETLSCMHILELGKSGYSATIENRRCPGE